ncbi:Similar to CNOT7: CCR4-NOT transcription complex subunit 7 (Homo sapiens) [Cotesia congregata]|uniref:poly(A)-specific ribonuclease n=1 Tax=Cotesia congregata TaxID=51543 RepID=A0A8J2H6U9_COTCN|nr:Similar to CNOT7: CCR4-NOT transcription complex subunit 7 (Homo sapiens) [Cotesia congregata]
MVRKSSGGGNSVVKGGGTMPTNEECGIRDVWGHNLEEEFRTIRQVVQQYPYVAMDTEFPGVVARPIGEFRTSADYQYQLLRCNVDLLRIIQLGLTFLNESGNTPGGGYTTWQFNFKFNLQSSFSTRGFYLTRVCNDIPTYFIYLFYFALFNNLTAYTANNKVNKMILYSNSKIITFLLYGIIREDMYAQDSIDMLQNSGIQFKKHEEEGIDPLEFAELLMTSGIVLMDDIKWLSFHSGYDFGYLLKLLTDQNLPQEESEFFELLRIYFPTIYDVKYLMKSCKNLKGGLQEVAEQLELQRVGPQHQAGSDSLLTGMVFFKMREMFFEDNIDDAKYCGHLYGLGTSFVVNGTGGYLESNGDNSSSS